MGFRIWLFRSVVCSSCVATAVLGWLTYLHTNAEAIRRKVAEQIQAEFQGVDVEVGSAWLQPFGGICVRDLRLTRRDDPTRPFLVVPSGTIYHDKEQLARGRLVIRKLELVQPTLLVRRDGEGNWNLFGIAKPGRAAGDDPNPTFVIRKGTVRYEDRAGGVDRPVFAVHDVNWTLVNDPPQVVAFQGEGRSVFGPVKWSGSLRRDQGPSAAAIELTDFHLTRPLIADLVKHVPELADHAGDCEARGSAKLELRHQPGGRPALKPDLRITLTGGRFNHPQLPLPLDALTLSLHYRDDQVTVERCEAKSGATAISFSVDGTVPPAGAKVKVEDLEQQLTYASVSIRGLPLSRELFDRLPGSVKKVHREFEPTGPVNLTYTLKRGENNFWSKLWEIKPDGMAARYEDFRYPLKDLRGTLEQYTNSIGADKLTVSLKGTVGGRPLTIAGWVDGQHNTADLRISGRDVPITDALFEAMVGNYRAKVEAIHPTGRGDFAVAIVRKRGEADPTTRITLDFRDLAIRYDEFPYPLEDMTGTLHITLKGGKTGLVFENFKGRHHGGEVALAGAGDYGDAGSVTKLALSGVGVPFDGDLARALTARGLQGVWRTLGPRGRLGFAATLTQVDPATPPNLPKPPSDITVTFHHIHADTIRPEFFPYELSNVALALRYAKNVVTLSELTGRHGAARVQLGASEIVIKPGGGVWGRFRDIQLSPLVADEDFLRALPAGLRSAVAALQPAGPITLAAGEVIVDTQPPAPPERPQPTAAAARALTRTVRLSQAPLPPDDGVWVYWDELAVKFAGASLKLGARLENVFGEVATRGAYRDGRLGAVEGNLDFAQAGVFGQPLTAIHAHLRMDPARAPGVLQVRNLKADAFGGTVTGQGRLVLEPTLRYDLALNAVGLKLEDIARHNRLGPDTQLSGRAMAALYLKGSPDDPGGLQGGGSIDVAQGRLYNLPPVLDLLKFLKLHAPDGTAFEEAHARFRVLGDKAAFDEIEMIGNLISLTGEGEVKLDGTGLKLDVYPIWSRVVRALPEPLRDGAGALSRGLFKVEVRGSIGGPKDYRQEAVPVLVEPVRRLTGRLQGQR